MSDWQGPDELKPLLKPVDGLILLPGNPRQGDVGAISQSLSRFGQLKPVVIDEDDVILAGNHTFMAAVALGWSHIAAVRDTDLEGSEKTAFALADNRLSDLATYDDEALLEMLSQVADSPAGFDGIGYDDDDMDSIAKNIGAPLDFDDLNPGSMEFDHKCPRCGFEFDDHNEQT